MVRTVPAADGDQLFVARIRLQDKASTRWLVRHRDGTGDMYWPDHDQGRRERDPADVARMLGDDQYVRWEPATALPRPAAGIWHWPAPRPGEQAITAPVTPADRVLVDDAPGQVVVQVMHPDGSAHVYDTRGDEQPIELATMPRVRREASRWAAAPTGTGQILHDDPAPAGKLAPAMEPEPAAEPAAPARDVDLRAVLADRRKDLGGAWARFEANMDALTIVGELEEQDRPATAEEQAVLAGWTAWGALPQLFEADPPAAFVDRAERLRQMLDETSWAAARRTTINAHYTNPDVVSCVWDAVQRLGFDGGPVLEPGCGSGLFIGLAPASARMYGVELDPTTARIAAALYPSARVRAESFAESPWKNDTFDAVVGNVPFGNIRLHDPAHNPGQHVMHNHFILKSLDLTRPGGLVAVLSSRFTMDAQDPAARAAMYERADLLAAVRLPTGAHHELAGTEAITDVLIFRKRMPGEPAGERSWLTSTRRPVPRADADPTDGDDPVEQASMVALNDYWTIYEGQVLGRAEVGHGMYGADTLRIRPDPSLPLTGLLRGALERSIDLARRKQTVYVPPADGQQASRPDPDVVDVPVARVGDVRQFEGHMGYDAGRREWTRLVGGLPEPFEVPASTDRELRALVGIRDAAVALLDAEAATSQDTPQIAEARAVLNRRYDDYVARYGPVTRYTASTSSRLDKFGNPIVAHRYPAAAKIFRDDPHSALVRALETYHEQTKTATKAPIFTRRVVAVRTPATRADTPEDALAISLDQVGRVDLPTIARLLQVDVEEARDRLGTLVYADPAAGGRLVPAAEYLSGNVRTKLAAARDAAGEDPRLQVNVDALQAVIPRDLEPEEITVRLGAVWLPESDVANFLAETLDDPSVRVQHLGGSNWSVTAGAKYTTAATSQWGTERMDALTIAERLMQQKRLVVTDDDGDGHRIVNPVETEAAEAKGHALQEQLRAWAWADPDRAGRLARIYNDTFNAIVLRDYSKEGQRLTLPGLVAGIHPHPHQRAAVARMIAEPSVGLFHTVGAGKTAEMVMGAMELRRLHLVSKPLVVVPNHMLEQFSREWLQWYPQANVLAAGSKDVTPDRRREFIARAATGDWDGIIMTQTAFKAVGVGHDTVHSYIDERMAGLRAQLEKANASGAASRTVKQMEKRIESAEERLKKKLDHPVDPGLTFEQMGVDYLAVDELHSYKNLTIVSHIDGVSIDGSDRATDLDMKITHLRAKAGPGGRVMAGATGTPIANSLAEAYVTQAYLRPDLLQEAGLTDFDSWAATFGQTVTRPEMKPAGDGFRMVTRFAKFQNIPELLRLWHVFGDVKTAADLNLPAPELALNPEGQRAPEIVAIPMNTAQTAFMQVLAGRAEMVHAHAVDPKEDNMPWISSDGRAAGLDIRLLRPDKQPAGDPGDLTKVQVAAARIRQIWAEHRGNEYMIGDTDQKHPTPGALQIVFADLGTPTDQRWNVYDGLKDELTGRGMDASRIRFIHEASTDAKKDRLFADCREGRVDVLIGSTQKMGVGTNMQDRAIALHHLDCPWRPADVEQREGRILRQGNQNREVQILRYVTEGSFDGYMWQTVARKAGFIDQVMHGRLDQREAEDLGGDSQQFGYNVVTAVASGNPLLLEKAQAQEDVTKLQRLAAAHRRDQAHRRGIATGYQRDNQGLTELLPQLRGAIERAIPTGGDAFRATVDGMQTRKRADAADWVRGRLAPVIDHVRQSPPGTHETVRDLIGLGGHTLDATITGQPFNQPPRVTVHLRGLEDHVRFSLPADDVTGTNGHGIITRMENLVGGLEQTLATTQDRIAANQKQIEQAQAQLGAPFPRADELRIAQDRLAEITARMQADTGSSADGPDQPPPGPTPPGPGDGPTPDEPPRPSTTSPGSPEQGSTPPPAGHRGDGEHDPTQQQPHERGDDTGPDRSDRQAEQHEPRDQAPESAQGRAERDIQEARDTLPGRQDRIGRLRRRLDRLHEPADETRTRRREQPREDPGHTRRSGPSGPVQR